MQRDAIMKRGFQLFNNILNFIDLNVT